MKRVNITGSGAANINGWRRPSLAVQRSETAPTSGSVIASKINAMVIANPAKVPGIPSIFV